MKEAGYIRDIVKLICAFPLVLPGIVSAMDYKGLEDLNVYTPHEVNNGETSIGCAIDDTNQLEPGKLTDLEVVSNLELCGFKGAAIAGVPATGNMFSRRDARKSRNLFDKSADYFDRIKKALTKTKEYEQPDQVGPPTDLYEELYNQNDGGRRSLKWRLMF
ncbi:MAG: hypothetical protein U9N50_10990 [Pseudomonadota bacterium]|nr:hypothetical protein [Pseudomonadota bacterium]